MSKMSKTTKSATKPSNKPSGRPRGADSARSHEALIEAARGHFAKRGFGPANVREIADAAGYTTSTLYHYFGDKRGLYVEVYRDAERRVADAYQAALRDAGGRQARLHAVLEAAIALHKADESVPLFLAAVPLDIRRHGELGRAIAQVPIRTPALLQELVGGELSRASRELVTLITSVTIGMALTVGEGGHAAYAATLRACAQQLVLPDEA